MMIVAAKFKLKPGKGDAFVQVAKPCIAATRKEEGCLAYSLYASTESDTEYLFFERWTSRQALDAHLASAHIKEFAAARLELLDGDKDVQVHEVAG